MDFRRAFAGIIALSLLTSCAGKTAVQQPVQDPAVTSSVQKPEVTKPEPYDTVDSMPLLSIRTENSDSNDFITKPVNRHVAESIASWNPKYVMPPEPYYEDCEITLRDADSSVLLDGVGGQVKVRGNWTSNYVKKPLRIKFQDKQSVLGLNGGAEMRNWVLLAEFKDASMLRNKAALAMAREILGADGLYAADAQFVEVVVNGEYQGVYLLTEQQQVNPHRVDISQPDEGYDGTDIGYFLEFDGYFDNEDELHRFHVDYAGNAPLIPFDGNGGSGREMRCLPESKKDPKNDVGFTIKSDIYSAAQRDFIAAYVGNVYKIMYAAAYEGKALGFDGDGGISEIAGLTPRQAVENVVDVDSLADMYIISELTCDADIYWSSFYMDVDLSESGDGKLRFEAPWDFDSGLGNKDRCLDGTGFYAANIVPDVNGGTEYGGTYETINPWLAVIIYEDWFQQIIREKWSAAYDGGVFSRTLSMIGEDKVKLSRAFDRNYAKWDNIADNSAFSAELSKYAAECRDQAEAADFLKSWLGSRVEFLNENWHL